MQKSKIPPCGEAGKSQNKGQSLIEVLIALAIVSLVALGLVKATTSSVKNSSFSKDQNQAVIMAQKKISEIINQKNQNPGGFFNPLPTYSDDISNPPFCLKAVVSLASLPTDTPNWIDAKMAKITVDVFWGEKDSGTANCGNPGKVYGSTERFETQITN